MNKQKQKDTVVKRVNDWLCAYQNTTDSYFNATQFLKDFNEHNPENTKKLMYDFLRLDRTKDFLNRYEKRKIEKSQVSDYQVKGKSPKSDNQQVSSFYVKKGKTLKDGSKIPDTYFFCKELFFEFGCWLSVDLRLDLYEIVWDNVVEYRNNLKGKFSKEFTDAITTIEEEPSYFKVYSSLNKTVFGKNINNENQRDSATEEQLKFIHEIESDIITLIKFGYIKTFEDVIKHIKSYRK